MNPSFEAFVPVFRRRPGMYLGSAYEHGVEYLISELVAIGLDFFMAGEATQVSVTHDGPVITIEDDGPGLPFDRPGDYGMSLAEDYFITIHRTPTGGGNSSHPQLNRLGEMGAGSPGSPASGDADRHNEEAASQPTAIGRMVVFMVKMTAA